MSIGRPKQGIDVSHFGMFRNKWVSFSNICCVQPTINVYQFVIFQTMKRFCFSNCFILTGNFREEKPAHSAAARRVTRQGGGCCIARMLRAAKKRRSEPGAVQIASGFVWRLKCPRGKNANIRINLAARAGATGGKRAHEQRRRPRAPHPEDRNAGKPRSDHRQVELQRSRSLAPGIASGSGI